MSTPLLSRQGRCCRLLTALVALPLALSATIVAPAGAQAPAAAGKPRATVTVKAGPGKPAKSAKKASPEKPVRKTRRAAAAKKAKATKAKVAAAATAAGAKKVAARKAGVVTVSVRRAPAARRAPVKTWRMYALDDADVVKGEVAAVTEDNEFVTIHLAPGGVVHRGDTPAVLENVKHGYTLRCVGEFSKFGEFAARDIALGATVDEVALSQRVSRACQKVAGGRGISRASLATPEPAPAPAAPAEKPAEVIPAAAAAPPQPAAAATSVPAQATPQP